MSSRTRADVRVPVAHGAASALALDAERTRRLDGAQLLQPRRVAGVRLLLQRGHVVEAAKRGHAGVAGGVEGRVALKRRLAAGARLEERLVDAHLVGGDGG